MRTLPLQMIRVLAPFVPLFSKRVWQNAQILLTGAFPQHRAENGKFCPARDGLGSTETLPSLPSGAKSR